MDYVYSEELKPTPFSSRAETMLTTFEKTEDSSSTPRKLSNSKTSMRESNLNRKYNRQKITEQNASNLLKEDTNQLDFPLKTHSGLTADTVFTTDTEDTSPTLDGRDISLEIKPIASLGPFPEVDDEATFTDIGLWNAEHFDEGSTECDIKKQQFELCVEESTDGDDIVRKGSFDDDIKGGYNSLFGSNGEEEETYYSLEGNSDELPSPTTRFVQSFNSMFSCSAINFSFDVGGNKTSHTSKRNQHLDSSFEEKAQTTAEAMKSVYKDGGVAAKELFVEFVELKEDWSKFSKNKIDELKFQFSNRKKKDQHTMEQQKKGFV